jgi:hypothetical protein
MKRKGLILLISFLVLVLLISILAYFSSWKYKSGQAEKASIYLEGYYDLNGVYPSSEEFYSHFPKKLLYGNVIDYEPHYVLEYKTNKLHEGAFGTPYRYAVLFDNHIRYYVSSCDTARRCNWKDFEQKNSPNDFSSFSVHNSSEPYYWVTSNFPALVKSDPSLISVLIPDGSSDTLFSEAKEGETYVYENFSYDASFFSVRVFSQAGYGNPDIDYDITEFSLIGKTGETSVSYDVLYCENISLGMCDAKSIRVEIPIKIYPMN